MRGHVEQEEPSALSGQQRSQWLRLFEDQSPDQAVIFLDLHRRIISWNPAAEKIFGYSSEQVLGKGFHEIFTAEDQQRGIDRLEVAIASSDTVSENDRWHKRRDGSTFWSTGTLTPLRDGSGQLIGYIKLIRDHTKIKEQLETLANKAEAASVANDRKELAITTLAHELRNLLASLVQGVRILNPEPQPRTAKLTQLLEEQIGIVQRLMQDLLDLSRTSHGKVSVHASPVVIQDVLESVLESARTRAQEKSLRVDLLASPVPLTVAGDATRLFQVFANLLDNAIKYTPDAGRIWIKATIEGNEAVVHLQDTGIGIPPNMLSSIFELFTQVDTETSRGLGIGLALVKEFVSLHHGTVQARSDGAGKGSEFTVRLPIRRYEQTQAV